MKILATGATGNVGRNVVDLLLKAGAPVRATSRDPQAADLPETVDVRFGDFSDPHSFNNALVGVEKVFLFPEPTGAHGFVEAAKRAGAKRVVLLSSMAVAAPDPGANPIAQMHLTVEQAVKDSGLEWTFVRPGAFAANILRWAQAVQDGRELRLPYAEATVSPIHERDIAAVAARALLEDDHAEAVHHITGPESLTQRRQAELIGEAVGRPISVVDLTGEEARA
ncbi:NAD(P)H-binding protein [Nocardiopsis rhodophaea]|uniref:NAD(P)H-binding protein n=1 Tax=Nocardiopsis rhodophaea TaxID=280238 RepID=UPI0031E3FC28